MDIANTKLIINADDNGGEISKHIYGHFSEHLGHCIYDGVWTGEGSAIANVRGIRSDIVEALRKAAVPVLRWPGGCFADEYHWQDGIGPREKRPCMVNTHWGGVTENNHFGTHEFMDLCTQVGCEPYICGNVGSGSVQEMQQWIEYLTFDGISPLADLRRSNGRTGPWQVRFWGVGNESWGCGGGMRPEFYADQLRRYATYCRNFGKNVLYKIGCGSSGEDYTWTEVVMREAARFISGLSVHYYTVPKTWAVKGSATVFNEDEWIITLKKALHIEELVAKHAVIMDRFDPDRRVGMIVDEWGTWYDAEPGTNPGFLYQQNTLRDALVAGASLNIFNKYCARVKMANIAQTINVLQALILTDGARMLLTPTYHVFEMYKVHQDAVMLPVALTAPAYAFGGESIPAVSVSASRDRAGAVNISLCHFDPHRTLPVSCELRGMEAAKVTGRVLTAAAMNAHNTFDKPSAVQPAEFGGCKLTGSRLEIALPPMSVVVVSVQ